MTTLLYKCPRCNYETNHKTKIKNHMSRKFKCGNVNNIQLTDGIKEIVLNDRVYYPPPPAPPPTHITDRTIRAVPVTALAARDEYRQAHGGAMVADVFENVTLPPMRKCLFRWPFLACFSKLATEALSSCPQLVFQLGA